MEDPVIRRLVFVLRALCISAVLILIVQNVEIYSSSLKLNLTIQGTEWNALLSDFNKMERFAIVLILNFSNLIWMYVIYQFWALCSLYAKRNIFSADNVKKFQNMSYGLIGMSVAQNLALPFLGLFLMHGGYIQNYPDMDLTAIDLNFMTAGVLFLLIAKIMQRAIQLQDEADLTI